MSNLDSSTTYYFRLAAAVSRDSELITGLYSNVVSAKTSGTQIKHVKFEKNDINN